MKISYKWLLEYLKVSYSPEYLANIMTNIGIEVENIENYSNYKLDFNNIVIGETIECIKHPESNKLTIAKVDIGTEKLTIVCGAPNIKERQKVAVAKEGAKVLINNKLTEIKKVKILNVLSEGMICAEDELGLGSNHEGIMIFDNNIQNGTPLIEIIRPYTDVVFEISLTPNRTDATSHYGVARDIAAYLQHRTPVILEKPSTDEFKFDEEKKILDIIIENTEGCKRYTGIVIKDIEVKESPNWLKNYLKAIGLKPINNVVDISNFVMFETGHPIHVFDLAKIKGNKIIIKTTEEGTPFITLDNIERKLKATDLMICNEIEPMCIAGIYGGLYSGISNETKDIFIEVAYFNPLYIRRTSRYHNIITDSSYRFERGVDPNDTEYVCKRAAMLIKQICGGKILSPIYDIYPHPIKGEILNLDYNFIDENAGIKIDPQTIKEILRSLEFNILAEKEKGVLVEVPTYRVDVTRPIDIVEEILRIYGYNEVPIPDTLKITITHKENKEEEYRYLISELLVNNGFHEIITNSISNENYYKNEPHFNESSLIKLLNPLNNELSVMRQTMLYSMLEVVKFNINHQIENLKLFEFGKTYFLKDNTNPADLKNYVETQHLAFCIYGHKSEQNWLVKSLKSDFFFLKYFVDLILKRLNITPDALSEIENYFYEIGLIYFICNNPICTFGKISKHQLKKFEINDEVWYAEFNWENIIHIIKNKDKITYKEISKYPVVRRDLSMILDNNVKYEDIKKLTFKVAGNILTNINLFDVYISPSLGENKKSYAISYYLQSHEKTLTDEEINNIMKKIINAYEKELNAKIRCL
ncbi:MAG: phenylalanine--tRNA ligase subunit beta [Bacteroidales bacterium]|nr:phenylalanine--tRNA ligase subunit beta [Bacteroidales bacterium]